MLAAAIDYATAAEIAAHLHLSEGTVRNYLSSAIRKLRPATAPKRSGSPNRRAGSRRVGLTLTAGQTRPRVGPVFVEFSSLRAMTETEELGRGGRLRGGAAGELVAAAYAAESAHGPRLAHGLSLADLAHAVALIEGGDLAGEDARALVRGLLELHAIPGDEFPWDPRSAMPSTRARPSSSGGSAARRRAGSARAGRAARRSASGCG